MRHEIRVLASLHSYAIGCGITARPAVTSYTPKAIETLYAGTHNSPPETQAPLIGRQRRLFMALTTVRSVRHRTDWAALAQVRLSVRMRLPKQLRHREAGVHKAVAPWRLTSHAREPRGLTQCCGQPSYSAVGTDRNGPRYIQGEENMNKAAGGYLTRIPFVSTCPRCLLEQAQWYWHIALRTLLQRGHPIEGYCVTCQEYWQLSNHERDRVAAKLAG